jgi:Glycosyl transferases group 1
MKLLYFNVIENNAPWGSECFMNVALQSIGVETVCIDYRKNRYQVADTLLALEPTSFDAVLVQRGDYLPLDLLQAITCPKIFWASELVSRCRDQDRMFDSGLFSHVLVRTPACKEAIVAKNWMPADQIDLFLSSYDPLQHQPLAVTQDIDILFVGSMTPRREQLFKKLASSLHISCHSAFGPAMTQLIARAKIVLNVHGTTFLDTETRVFEVLGCGGFMISEKLSSENPFEPGKHYIEAATEEELVRLCQYYLLHEQDSKRKQIAAAGHKEAMAKHTYLHRAIYLKSLFEKYMAIPNHRPAFDRGVVAQLSKKEKYQTLLSYPLSLHYLNLKKYIKNVF